MPLSPSQTRELLASIEHLPNRKLGQNFLIDGNIVRKSIELAALHEEECVVEIGPGLGTLTRALLATGAKVHAVERDATLAAHLRAELVPDHPNLQLIEGDCLNHPLAGLEAAGSETEFSIVANLPYAISSPWMEAVLCGPLPRRMVLMLQKEAADRYATSHGTKNFGAISIFLQSAYHIHSRHLVAASCFHPTPKVDSVLLRLDRKEEPRTFPEEARQCIRRIFTQRRKQLAALCRRDSHPAAGSFFERLLAEGHTSTVRPEEIPVQQWIQLADIENSDS
ncbi:MAG: 16S rRNA (adenine(1518)-N(6)/adenine(1519)-N(6))-dimethyltransferase RsmA [Coraliomargaritaceae bacterium]